MGDKATKILYSVKLYSSQLSKYIWYRPIIILITIYTTIFSYITITRHHAFLSCAWDLGIYTQVLWSTMHGRPLFYTVELAINPSCNFFGMHFAPILFLILPIFALYPVPETLLILQSFIIALGALPLYQLTEDVIGNKKIGLGFAMLYLTYFPLIGVNIFDFHVQSFLPVLFLYALYYMQKERWLKCSIYLALALMTLEFTGIIVAFVGIYGLWLKKEALAALIKKRVLVDGSALYPLIIVTTGFLWFLFTLRIVHAINPPIVPLMQWSLLGNNLEEVIINAFNPERLFKALTYDLEDKMFYVLASFAPLIFLPLLSPSPLIMAFVWFLASLLSNTPAYYTFGTQYPAFYIPFIFLSAVQGFKKLTAHLDTINIGRRIVIAMLICNALLGTGVALSNPLFELPIVTEHEQLLKEAIKLVPSNASILTQNNIFPHLARRTNAYVLTSPENVEYILIDLKSHWFAHSIKGMPILPLSQSLNELLSHSRYGILFSADGILLFKRGYEGEPLIFQPFKATYDYSSLAVLKGVVIKDDQTSRSGKVLACIKGSGTGVFWYGPYAYLPPGQYEVIFQMKVDSKDVGYIATLDVVADYGQEVFATKRIYGHDFNKPNEWKNITMSFSIGVPKMLEFRGLEVSNTNLYLDFIDVRQTSLLLKEKPIQLCFDFRELILYSGSIYAGLLIHSPNDVKGMFWYGPYVTLPPGTYKVTFLLKISTATPSDLLLTLEVTANLGTRVLASMNVTEKDFICEGCWQPFTLTFQLDQTTCNIEFRGKVFATRSEIILSNIELHKVS